MPKEDVDWSEAAAWLVERETAARVAGQVPPMTFSSDVTAFKPVNGARARGIGLSTTEAPTLGSASGGNRVPAIAYACELRDGINRNEATAGRAVSARARSLYASSAPGQGPESHWIVRRFSPLETLRLQGYDDDWLDVKLGGKPLTDADRYRLTGNAFPVSVAAWILERLQAYVAAEEDKGD